MAQLYADENFDYRVVEHLRMLGHDVLTAQEAGKGGQQIPDNEVLANAITLERAVLTFDRRDFKRLHQSVAAHWGIVACTMDPDPQALARRIDDEITRGGTLKGRITVITRPP